MKVKPIWILLKQETVSGISWAICKSAPCSRQTTTPAPYHSVFLQAGCPSCRPTNSVKALKSFLALSALKLLVGHQEQHLACKNGLMRCLSGARCRLFAYGPADTTAIPKPHHIKSRLVLPFWYLLTQVVLEKRPLNSCSSSSVRVITKCSKPNLSP